MKQQVQQQTHPIEMVNTQEYHRLNDNETNTNKKNQPMSPIHIESSRVQGERLATLYFISLGIASLLSWSTILSTLDYFDTQFPDGQVSFYFPAAFSATILLTKLFMVWFKEVMSLNTRIATCLSIQCILLCLLPIVAALVSHSKTGYWITMLTLLVLGTVSQISYGSSMGLAGYFPSKYMSNMTTGTGLSGVMCNCLRVVTLICFRNGEEKSYLYDMVMQYGITAGFLAYCVFLHYKFVETKYASEELNKYTVAMNNDEYTAEEFPMLVKGTKSARHLTNIKNSLLKLYVIFKRVKALSIFMVVIYIQTLMLFPGVMLKQDVPIEDLAWKVVIMQFVYNISDTAGKYFTENRALLNRKFIYNLILCRFIFYFTFITQAITKDAPILDDMWFTVLNIALFGITNGFTTSAIFIFGPEEFEGEDKEIVGFLLLNCLSFGVMAGSFLALTLSNI